VLHVVQHVLLVLIGGDLRELLGERLLPQPCDTARPLSLCRSPGVHPVVVVVALDEVGFAEPVRREVLLLLLVVKSHRVG